MLADYALERTVNDKVPGLHRLRAAAQRER